MAEEATEKATPGGRGKRSRREVLAGAAGALGVLAAQTLGKATPAQAGSDRDEQVRRSAGDYQHFSETGR